MITALTLKCRPMLVTQGCRPLLRLLLGCQLRGSRGDGSGLAWCSFLGCYPLSVGAALINMRLHCFEAVWALLNAGWLSSGRWQVGRFMKIVSQWQLYSLKYQQCLRQRQKACHKHRALLRVSSSQDPPLPPPTTQSPPWMKACLTMRWIGLQMQGQAESVPVQE